METKQMLPNATAVLVLGICSIVFGCFFIGIALGIVGIVLSKKGRELYKANPSQYEGYGSLNAGFIMSIIGLCISSLYLLYWLIIVAILGGTAFSLSQFQ